ncbi:MAG: hypothetical protein AB1473_13130 [Thermodesulfobacteriota bacterium]
MKTTEEIRQELLETLTAESARYAIMKKGTAIHPDFMTLSSEAKVVLLLAYLNLQIARGDRVLNGGFVELDDPFLAVFNLNSKQGRKALDELVAKRFLKPMEDNIYKVIETWRWPEKDKH